MATYQIQSGRTLRESQFAIGVRTGTLYFMQDHIHGYVIAGRGEMAGREGKLHRNDPKLFRALPVGTKIEIIT